jgi:hypothetical protein
MVVLRVKDLLILDFGFWIESHPNSGIANYNSAFFKTFNSFLFFRIPNSEFRILKPLNPACRGVARQSEDGNPEPFL